MNKESELTKEDLQKKIAELEAEVVRLEKDLIHDHLTGLKTRKFFEEEAEMYLDAVSRSEDSRRREWFGFRNVSVILFDTDYFKKVNDTYGHLVGDEVLKIVSEVVENSLREGDTACRWGGEEIAVLLLGANEKDAIAKANEIREEISKLKFSVPELSITISAGVASSEKDINLLGLIERADQALYKAKETGRNKVVGYSEVK